MSRSVARGTMLGIAGQVWHLAAAFLLYAFLARRLGPAGFGDWKLALSVLNWFELFVNAGLVKVVTKAIAERPDDSPTIVRGAYLGQGVLALVLLAAALIAAGPIAAGLGDPDIAYLLRLSALDIPLYAAFMLAASILLGVQRFERHALAMTVYATAKFASIAALVWFGFSVPGALVGNAIASVVGFAVTFTPWPVRLGGRRMPSEETRAMAPLAVPFLTQNLVEGVAVSADLWFVKRLAASAATVGLYGSAATLAEVPLFLFVGLNRALFPSIARVQAEGDTVMVARFARQGVRLAIMVTVLGVAVIAATGRQALTFVYSEEYAGVFVPLAILMVAACGRTVWSTCTDVLMVRNRRRTALGILGAAVLAELPLLWVLTRGYGSVGAATAVAITSVLAAVASGVALRDLLGARLLSTLLRSVVAAAAVGVVLHFVAPPPAALVLAYPVAGLVYAAFLWLLGEVEHDDIESIRHAIGR